MQRIRARSSGMLHPMPSRVPVAGADAAPTCLGSSRGAALPGRGCLWRFTIMQPRTLSGKLALSRAPTHDVRASIAPRSPERRHTPQRRARTVT